MQMMRKDGKEKVDGVSDRLNWQRRGIRSVDIYCYTAPLPAQRILTKAHKYASPREGWVGKGGLSWMGDNKKNAVHI